MTGQLPAVKGSSWNARTPQRPGRPLMWPAVAIVLGVILLWGSIDSSTPGTAATAPPLGVHEPAKAAPAEEEAEYEVEAPAEMSRSLPTRLTIPEIAVDAPFTGLTLGRSGELNAPPADDTNLVGWFTSGVTPGELGTAIVAGHVDTMTGPAVFAQLSVLQPGSRIDIAREDGSTATFRVDSVDSFSKADFPNERVYADTPDAQLRLITCGGDYDRKAKDYTENVVVFAHLDTPA
ncbi:class F sortase [Streptomyces sp. NPDC020681]|uniref:class F sortase n=1 Tax=Streptomyces sp. NPDC020681 TaxID=3365083 RepID=UPI00378B979A